MSVRELREALVTIQDHYGAPDPDSAAAVDVLPLLEAAADAAAAAAFSTVPSWVTHVPTGLNADPYPPCPVVAQYERLWNVAHIAHMTALMWRGVGRVDAGHAAALWLGETLFYLDLSA